MGVVYAPLGTDCTDQNPISPPGTTGLVVDPGIVYNWGAFATGLRLAFQTHANTNVGLIPLINFGLADLGGATWFIEGAFPTFIQSQPTIPRRPATMRKWTSTSSCTPASVFNAVRKPGWGCSAVNP